MMHPDYTDYSQITGVGMKRIGLLKALCFICVVGGLACKLFINNNMLGSILAICLMALAVVILAYAMHRSRQQ